MEEAVNPLDDLFRQVGVGAGGERHPGAYYSPEGDCVFVYNEDVAYDRDRIDELLTVYRALDDRRIVGLQIKGVRKLPVHQFMEVRVRSGGRSKTEAVQLLLLTLRQRPEIGKRELKAYQDAIFKVGPDRIVEGLELART